jgi:hypothetical protein
MCSFYVFSFGLVVMSLRFSIRKYILSNGLSVQRRLLVLTQTYHPLEKKLSLCALRGCFVVPWGTSTCNSNLRTFIPYSIPQRWCYVTKNRLMGVCTLRWIISTNVPLPKNSYGNVKMIVYFDIINLVGNYMVINVLKSQY